MLIKWLGCWTHLTTLEPALEDPLLSRVSRLPFWEARFSLLPFCDMRLVRVLARDTGTDSTNGPNISPGSGTRISSSVMYTSSGAGRVATCGWGWWQPLSWGTVCTACSQWQPAVYVIFCIFTYQQICFKVNRKAILNMIDKNWLKVDLNSFNLVWVYWITWLLLFFFFINVT